MRGFSFKTRGGQSIDEGWRKPVADKESKSVMLSAERGDEIEVESTVEDQRDGDLIPNSITIKQRVNTFYGPKLHGSDEMNRGYLITAPGPDSYLSLWSESTSDKGGRESWVELTEIKASFKDNQSRYHRCPYCNKPFKTADHERQAAIGQCPNI